MENLNIDIDYTDILPAFPNINEESWKKTNAKEYFLKDDEVLAIDGKILINKPNLSKWGIINNLISTTEMEDKIKEFLLTINNKNSNNILFTDNILFSLINIIPPCIEFYKTEFSNISLELNDIIPHQTLKTSYIDAALAVRRAKSCGQEIVIKIGKNTKERCLIIDRRNNTFSQLYTSISVILEESSCCSLVILENDQNFALHHIHLELKNNANLNFLRFIDGNSNAISYTTCTVKLNKSTTFNESLIIKHSGKCRLISEIMLYNNNAYANSSTAIIAKNSAHIDYEPIQHHVKNNTKSKLKARIIANDKAKVSFQGLIRVERNVLQTEALQDNKNLLLSKKAKISASPRLEILPDDVICKHGSATSTIDKSQIYYLTSRGFTEEEAQKILISAFINDGCSALEHDTFLRNLADYLVE